MLPQATETPKVRPGGLVTVAFLKARLDEGSDHLGIFMPLVFDVICRQGNQSFTTADIQEALAIRHRVTMPQEVVTTLLKRAIRDKCLLREAGRYRRNPGDRTLPLSDIDSEKAQIEQSQRTLADALRVHAERHNLFIPSTDAALEAL